jgi:hypothetical protein
VVSTQGDLFGRIFAYWATFFFGQFFFNFIQTGPNCCYFLSKVKSFVLILQNKGWAKFWAIFSQTHLVTLSPPLEEKTVCGNQTFEWHQQKMFFFLQK